MVRYKALSLAFAMTVVSTAAFAQGRWYYAGPGPAPGPRPVAISPQQAAIAVRAAGLRAIAPPVLRGPYYVVPSTDRYGRMNRAFVDAQMGQVVRIRPMAIAAYGRPPAPIPRVWNPGPPRPDADDDIAAAPPYPGAPPAPTTGRASAEPADVDATGTLPPPPSRLPQRRAKQATGSAHPTPPRNIPGVKPKPAEPKHAAVPPAGDAKPDAVKTPPRVVLPGGPTAKGDQSAAAKSETQVAAPAAKEPADALAGANPPTPAKPETGNGIPPMPPMQGFE